MYIINLLFENGTITREGLLSVGAFIVALLIAVILHELAHGLSALAFGDNTSLLDGRLTLNPAKHFDMFGFLMMIVVGFGWARPVRINVNNFKHKRVGMIVVSLAGIIANLLVVFVFAGIYVLGGLYYPYVASSSYLMYFLSQLCALTMSLNISFALFNLLPIFPLDGYRLLSCFLPQSNKLMFVLRSYSMYILLGLLMLNYLPIISEYSPLYLYISKLGEKIYIAFISFWGMFI